MGEQSAKSLRGEKMEDVIFSGSDARKPTGAAEVRLRFSGVTSEPVAAAVTRAGHGAHEGNGHGPDDARQRQRQWKRPRHTAEGLSPAMVADMMSAVRDVEVTRRLYRSGESEYLIDGHTCRLQATSTNC